MTHVELLEDARGNLVDIEYYCCATCYTIAKGQDAHGHAWPCGMETDHDVYCDNCGDLMREGIEGS